jgi:proton translocating ATP synthase F1 alpha subunit
MALPPAVLPLVKNHTKNSTKYAYKKKSNPVLGLISKIKGAYCLLSSVTRAEVAKGEYSFSDRDDGSSTKIVEYKGYEPSEWYEPSEEYKPSERYEPSEEYEPYILTPKKKDFIIYEKFGEVERLADGIAEVTGFTKDVKFGEVVYFKGLTTLSGMVMSLTYSHASCVLFFNIRSIREGDYVIPSGKLVTVSVGKALFGRVIDTFGDAIDISNSVIYKKPNYQRPVDSKAAGISARDAVYEPMLTGQLIIDAITPIGLGQRELIIGDRQTGKTTTAWDTMMNQCNDQHHFFIYSFLGQKRSFVSRITRKYSEFIWYKRAVFVASTCSEPAPLQYLSAFSSCSVGETIGIFSSDAVVAYDDLSKQAVCYRQVSLLLRRPPGREAFPGDIFYLHSRLLERAVKFHSLYGAGSSTALPIIETQLGDVSAYIPTNVISITDGQIFFDNEGFKKGIRPALDVNLSVSRVGSICQ